MNLLDITLKIIIGLLALFTTTKILGKTQISQITPFDFISALVLGELVGNGIFDKEVKIIQIVLAILVWMLLMFTIEIIAQKVLKTRGLLDGNPSIVIRQGHIDRDQLKKNRLNINELLMLLRHKDVFSVREVEYGILEPNGELTVLKKSNYMNVQRQDINIPYQTTFLPITFISDGNVLWDNVASCGFDDQWLTLQLNGHNIEKPEDVFYAEWQQGQGLHIVPVNANTSTKNN